MKKNILIFIFCFSLLSAFSQIQYSGEATLQGISSTEKRLPFWMFHNKRGRISENTSVVGLLSGKAVYEFGASSNIEVGAGVLGNDDNGGKVFLDEVYIQFKNDWVEIIGGRKQKKEFYNGLSSTNENILWSLNARPIPGIQLKTSRPIYLDSNGKFGFEASWNEYYMGDNPGAEEVRLHHKKVQILYHFRNGWSIKAGIQHFVQWGGSSTKFGDQPKDFSDYLRIITGRAGDDNSLESDQANALGNHLGSWELYISKEFKNKRVSFIFNNLFEDGSGSRGANFPDGRYGVFVEAKDPDQLINSLIYELYYTRNQSQTGPHLYDNYFNNDVYPFGWTYKGRTIGAPFFTYDQEVNQVINNIFIAHHIGLGGQLSISSQKLPYKILLSYAQNRGAFKSLPDLPEIDENVLNFYSKWRLINFPVVVNMDLGFELNSRNEPIFATGLILSKRF